MRVAPTDTTCMKPNSLAARTLALIKLPVHLAQVFTGAKSFSANPVIGNRLLNVLGLHVFRTVLAAAIAHFRFLCLRGFISQEHRAAYHHDGFVLIENFLPRDDFNALDAEVRELKGEVRQCVQGDTLTHRILLTDKALAALPACSSLLADSRFSCLLKYAASRNSSPIYYVQSIKSNVIQGAPDPQRTLHSDTFHSTMKAWLFLDEVSDLNGPFTYVAGSHRLSFKRLRWEYHNSIKGSTLANSYAARGSLRVTDDDLGEMGLQAPTVFRVPANTLVIANTNGFHRRGAATQPSNRMEIWAYSRTNPFNPVPGFNFSWYRKLSHVAIEKYLARKDKIAADKGAVASWHVVAEDALHVMPAMTPENLSDDDRIKQDQDGRQLPEVA